MKTKQTIKRITALIPALILMLIFPVVALATDISVKADATSVKVGDTVTVTVVVSAEHIAVADGSFTYDPALLTYVSSNGGASDGSINMVAAQEGGASSLTAVIKFAAIGQGEAVVNVSMDSVLSYDEQVLETAEAGVSITVAAADAAAPGTEPSVPPVNLAQTGVAAENVEGAAAQMYIWRSLSSLTLPSGYVDKQVTYKGEFVGGAAIPDSEDLTLLYLSEETGENAGYYIYNEEKNTLFPYYTLLSVSASYTIVKPEEGIAVPEGFEETTLTWKEKQMPAWTQKGSDGTVYLVYVRNAAGEKGFYLFSTEDESLQRYKGAALSAPAQPTAQPSAEPSSAPVSAPADIGGFAIDQTLFYALCGACAVLAAAVIVLAVLYTSKKSRSKRRAARWEKRNDAAPKKEDETDHRV